MIFRPPPVSAATAWLLLLLFGLSIAEELKEQNLGDLSNPDNQNIQLFENDRVAEYHNRNYTWPPSYYIPDTPGWKRLMQSRFDQVAEMTDPMDRYEGYVQTVGSAFLVPNFTQHGFGLARCPDDLTRALQQGIRDGLEMARYENDVQVINGARSLFIDRPDLTNRVLQELQHYAEEWSQVELVPYRAYGFRLYQNNSQLTMHVDKKQTHIVSFILHIDSSDDAEPWPIVIEDFHGNTHEVVLTPGDMLFYESAKCWHGRPRRLNGSWYSSIFVHYYPKHGWYHRNHALEAHYAVPPHWNQDFEAEPKQTKLKMVGTSMVEPDCPDEWCRLSSDDAIRWSGPGEDGVWIAPNFERYPFHPKPGTWEGATAASLSSHDEL